MEVGGASGYIHNQSYWLVLIHPSLIALTPYSDAKHGISKHLNSTDISGREIRAGFFVE